MFRLEQLIDDILGQRKPRSFIVRGNRVARRIGLQLEQLNERVGNLRDKAEEEQFGTQAVMTALPDGALLIDTARRVRFANMRAQELLQLGGDPIGSSLLEATRDATIDAAARGALLAAAPQTVAIKTAFSSVPRHFEVRIEPIGKETPYLAGAVVLVRDLTDLKQAEQVRRDFVANVSHELRTPLSIFRGYLETLLENPRQPPGELLRILETMERHSNRLSSLVEDVLSLAQLEANESKLEPESFDLSECVRAVVRDWQQKFVRKHLEIQTDIPPHLIITADPVRVQEMLYNLVDNAVKYSKPNGWINISLNRDADNVHIVVKDSGIGIPARDLPRIFERFYRVDKARSREVGGTGLGLSIVKHIAQLHGGAVHAASKLGEGTTMTVTLPSAVRARDAAS